MSAAKWKAAGAPKKAAAVDGFDIVLADTVLFPEGGGQGNMPSTCVSFHDNWQCNFNLVHSSKVIISASTIVFILTAR